MSLSWVYREYFTIQEWARKQVKATSKETNENVRMRKKREKKSKNEENDEESKQESEEKNWEAKKSELVLNDRMWMIQ
jgi:hypothetical protein